MLRKRPASCNASAEETKRQKNVMIEKVALLDVLKEGKCYAAVVGPYNLSESTVRYIKRMR